MRNKLFSADLLALYMAFALALFLGSACEPEPPPAEGPAAPGDYSECSYTSGLSHSDYSSARVFYPCETEDGPFAATTVTGGWTNTKEDMDWLSEHVVTHGYIVFAMTPNNNTGNNPEWERAHKAGISMLESENAESGSPIYGLVDTGALQVMGFSKGGGGALLASSDLGSQIQSTQALAPYMDSGYDLSGVDSATITYTGTEDTIASPGAVVDMYNSLPDAIERTLAYFDGVTHLDWVNGGSYQDRMKTYITSWMKVYLDGDASYEEYIDGHQSWFYEFAHNADSGAGGGGCN